MTTKAMSAFWESCPGRDATSFMSLRRAGTAKNSEFDTIPVLRSSTMCRIAPGTQGAAQ
jgi:hypothetical protein